MIICRVIGSTEVTGKPIASISMSEAFVKLSLAGDSNDPKLF